MLHRCWIEISPGVHTVLPSLRRLVFLYLTLAAVSGSPLLGHAVDVSSAAAPVHTKSTMVDVGGHALNVVCEGTGRPAVVLESGYGQDLSTWNQVEGSIARSTRVCAYNRAGIWPSQPLSGKRSSTARSAVHDLHVLLGRLRIAPPYVLVGHSIGGINVRLYASVHRQDVAGMILLDASHENQCRWPLCSNPPLEHYNIRASFAQLRAATHGSIRGSLGAMPLIVVTRGLYSPGATLVGVWERLQRELASASRNSIHVVASQSAHDIPHEQPALVVKAVRVVLQTIRSHAHHLPPCQAAFPAVWHARCVA